MRPLPHDYNEKDAQSKTVKGTTEDRALRSPHESREDNYDTDQHKHRDDQDISQGVELKRYLRRKDLLHGTQYAAANAIGDKNISGRHV